MKKLTLTEQFLFICVSIIGIVIISLGMVLPKTLLPVYEENLYNYLNQSLNLLEKPENNRVDSEVAYIYIDGDKNILVSSNLSDVVNIKDVKVIINKVNNKDLTNKKKDNKFTLFLKKRFDLDVNSNIKYLFLIML